MTLKKLLLFLFLLLSPSTISVQAQESAPSSQPSAAASRPAPISEMDPDRALAQKYKARFQDIQSDLDRLQSRLDEGQKEIKNEASKLTSFLQIEEITPEEFNPFLNQWKVMRDSYRDVLGDLNGQIEEVNQARIRLESKLRLWELKEADLKLLRDQTPKGKLSPEEAQKLADTHKVIQDLGNERDEAEDLLNQLGKTKTQLTLALDECNKNYGLLQVRWKEIRFTYLKMRQQPKFSWETLNLAFQELNYRLRDYKSLTHSLVSYFKDMGQWLTDKTLRLLLYLGLLILTAWALFALRQKTRIQKEKPEEITLFERFGLRMLITFTHSYPILFPLLAFGIFLLTFLEARENLGLFLFSALAGFYAVWFFNRSLKTLFVDHGGKTRLLSISPPAGAAFYRRCSWLVRFIYLDILLHFLASLLGYESEATRLLNWILVIFIFGLLISLISSRWFSEFGEGLHQRFSNPLRHVLRGGLTAILLAVIGFDAAGYTHLSDYLAISFLKSLGLIPLFFFLKKGILELIDYKIFIRSLTQFHVPEDLRVKWKITLKQWTRLGLAVGFIYWIAVIWGVTPELWDSLKWLLSRGFTVATLRISVGLLFAVFLTLYASVLISRLIQAVLERNIFPRRDWDPGIRNALTTGVHYVIILIGLMVALRLLGFDIRNITVLAGAFGVGLGFGLQNLANNFASGIVLLIERPVKVGDVIQVGTLTGKVKKIGPRATVIETPDQSAILIPNGELLAGQVTNWTYGNSIGGVSIPVGVAYGSDVDRVKRVLLEIAAANKEVLKNPTPRIEFKAFGDSSLNFLLRVWTDVEERVDVQTELMTSIEKAFRENKIEIPFPRREVILHQANEDPKKEHRPEAPSSTSS